MAKNTRKKNQKTPDKTVKLHRDFLHDQKNKLINALLLAVVAVILLSGMLLYLLMNPPRPEYFATTGQNEGFQRLIPESRPFLSTGLVLSWAVNASIEAYSFNYVNYKKQLDRQVRKYFTEAGWKEYYASLTDSGVFTDIVKNRLVVSAIPLRMPTMLDDGVIGGRYVWRIQVPLLVRYESSGGGVPRRIMVTLLISRIPTTESPKGIGIEQFVAEPIK